MASKRKFFFNPRVFCFVLGILAVGLVLFFNQYLFFFKTIENKLYDLRFYFKNERIAKSETAGSVKITADNKISNDIIIAGIENSSLLNFGKWPWPRYRVGDFLETLGSIQDQNKRERSVFLDIFYIDQDFTNPEYDAYLIDAVRDNGRVLLEPILDDKSGMSQTLEEYKVRMATMFEKYGEIKEVQGPWQDMVPYLTIYPPLQPLAQAAKGYGHPNYESDEDEIYRRQGVIAKYMEVLAEFDIETLTSAVSLDASTHQQLVYMDKLGNYHDINISPNDSSKKIESLIKKVKSDSAPKLINAGQANEKQIYTGFLAQNHFIPSITLAMSLEYLNRSLNDLEIVLGKYVRIKNPQMWNVEKDIWEQYVDKNGRTLDKIDIPIDIKGRMIINFMGPRSSATNSGAQTFSVRPFYSYASMKKGLPQVGLENKLVLVGAFSNGMAEDEKTTPRGLMFGVEIHANALNTIIKQNFIQNAPLWLAVLIIFIFVGLISFLTGRFPTYVGLVALIAGIVIYFFIAVSVFDFYDIILNITTPIFSSVLAYLLILVYRLMTEEKDKRMIRNMFGRYVSPKVVDQILASPPELGGVDKELTVLFSDIRGFTTLSETMTPQELVGHLNLYLTAMTDTIMEYYGTLDKYVGDEIMCFWGAPINQADHAIRACKCALKQMEVLGQLNVGWPPEKRIDIGIGVNSGIMTVGNMGSLGRMNYTLMGDNVNLGARLEGTNKTYKTHIIISEYTYGLVRDSVIVRELDNIRVKGKNKPVIIYELVDVVDNLEIEADKNLKK